VYKKGLAKEPNGSFFVAFLVEIQNLKIQFNRIITLHVYQPKNWQNNPTIDTTRNV
jgi:hypothetical protein